MTSTEIATTDRIFSDSASFELSQRAAKLLAASSIIPDTFRGDVANCTIALSMAGQMGVHPLTFMQSCYVIHGKPAIDAKFAIALLNTSGKTKTNIRFVYSENDTVCRAIVTDTEGHEHEGECSVAMANGEGWVARNAKWKTMTKQMLKYRAAMFLIRGDFPEVILGMHSDDELRDSVESVKRDRIQQVDHIANLKSKSEEPKEELKEEPEPVIKMDKPKVKKKAEPVFDKWDATLTEAKAQMVKCKTIEDLQAIVLKYDAPEINMEIGIEANEVRKRIKGSEVVGKK